jgi:hypothetical protein
VTEALAGDPAAVDGIVPTGALVVLVIVPSMLPSTWIFASQLAPGAMAMVENRTFFSRHCDVPSLVLVMNPQLAGVNIV